MDVELERFFDRVIHDIPIDRLRKRILILSSGMIFP